MLGFKYLIPVHYDILYLFFNCREYVFIWVFAALIINNRFSRHSQLYLYPLSAIATICWYVEVCNWNDFWNPILNKITLCWLNCSANDQLFVFMYTHRNTSVLHEIEMLIVNFLHTNPHPSPLLYLIKHKIENEMKLLQCQAWIVEKFWYWYWQGSWSDWGPSLTILTLKYHIKHSFCFTIVQASSMCVVVVGDSQYDFNGRDSDI